MVAQGATIAPEEVRLGLVIICEGPFPGPHSLGPLSFHCMGAKLFDVKECVLKLNFEKFYFAAVCACLPVVCDLCDRRIRSGQ